MTPLLKQMIKCKEAGATQQQIGDVLGVTKQRVGQVLKGYKKSPKNRIKVELLLKELRFLKERESGDNP